MNLRRPLGLTPVLAVYASLALFMPLWQGVESAPMQEESFQIDRTRIADYDIQVHLDTGTKKLSGKETLTWLNSEGPPTSELKLHLYMNAFRNAETRLMSSRGDWSAEDAGWIDIKSIRLPGGGIESPEGGEEAEQTQADEDLSNRISVDETVMTVRLPRPVSTGARIRLEIDFEVKLPRVFTRAGYSSDYFMVAQWFPKVGVYAGGRWICPQYERYTEFYADFGRYRVEITVPKNYRVGATGILDSTRTRGDEKTLVYTAHPVHDFAWAACPQFREVEEKVEYQAGGKAHIVNVLLLMQRDRMDQSRVYLDSVKLALKEFGRLYGPYPYSRLTVVDPAPGRGQNSGGMEYPMLIVGGSSWLETYLFPGDREIEGVTIHEFGHQYWYGAVANNEFEEAWIDEGLTSYSADKVTDTLAPFGSDMQYPKILSDSAFAIHPFLRGWRADFDDFSALLRLGLPLSELAKRRIEYLRLPSTDPVTTQAYRPFNGYAYASSAYAKPELALRTLEGVIGEEGVARVLRRLYERFRFSHVSGAELRALASEVAGEDLEWFFGQVLDGTAELDYAVENIEVKEGAGEGESNRWLSVITIRRLGQVTLPQKVRVAMENGRKIDFKWDRRGVAAEPIWMEGFEPLQSDDGTRYRMREGKGSGWLTIEILSTSPAVSAAIDPDFRYQLDVNLANNSYRVESDPALATRGEISAVRLWGRWLHGLSVFN
jgi:hypothetical protein